MHTGAVPHGMCWLVCAARTLPWCGCSGEVCPCSCRRCDLLAATVCCENEDQSTVNDSQHHDKI